MSTTKYIIDNQNSSLSGQSVIGNLSATTFYGDGSNLNGIYKISDNHVDIIYNDLYDKIISSGLTAGTTYRLTDYKSVNFVNGYRAANDGVASSVAYAGLIDGSLQIDNGFSNYTTIMDFQRSGSYYFDGTNYSQVLIQNNGEFIIGTNDFTIEWYQYLETGASCCPRPFSIGTYSQLGGVQIGFSFEGSPYFWWNGSAKTITLNTSPLNNWSHFAITRQSGMVKVFQDGNKVYEELLNDDLQSTSDLAIGSETVLNADGLFRGYITNFRFISGSSIYNSNFTPSTKPLYSTDETILLLSVKDQNNLTENNVYGQNLNITSLSLVFNPNIPFTDYDIYVGGEFLTYDYFASRRLVKLNANGSVDESFYIGGRDFGIDGEVRAVKILSDGKVLVGGTFYSYSGETHQFLLKLNTDGTLDQNFSTTTNGYYIDGFVFDICVENNTGNIFIGGSFLNVNAEPHQRLAKLDVNGNIISSFVVDFDNIVNTIELSQDKSSLYVGGCFATVNSLSTGFICKIEIDSLNITVPASGGFNTCLNRIKVDNSGRLICVGNFTAFDGVDAYKIMRLNSDLSSNDYFFGINSFDAEPYAVDVDYLNNIILGGDFLNYNSTSHIRIIRLLDDGSVDPDFSVVDGSNNSIYYLSIAPKNRILICGEFGAFGGSDCPKLVRIMGDDQSPVYNSLDLYTSEEEVLYLKALSNCQIEKIAYSEKYINDLIEYSPYINVLGLTQQIYNNVTLNDGNIVTGFDLQWDNINNYVYFDMPENNPIYFGHYFYFYADFYNGEYTYYSSFTSEPILPGYNKPEYQNTDGDSDFKETNIIVSTGGTRVILTDLIYDDFLNYNIDSLYVETIYRVEDIYGYITRRKDTSRKIDVPFDFRNIKYRRYEMNLNYVNSDLYTHYYSWIDNLILYLENTAYNTDTTGKYKDFNVFENPFGSNSVLTSNIKIDSIGGPDGGYWNAGGFDNNVFFGENKDNNFNGFVYENTFMENCLNNNLEVSYFTNNIIANGFENNKITNKINIYSNVFGYGFQQNTIKGYYFINNNIYGPNSNNFISGFFGYNTIGSYFTNNNLNYNFQSNDIGNYFNLNDIKNNFYSNLVASNFEKNLITSEFQNSSIGASFSNNNINESVNYISTNSPISNLTVNTAILNKTFNSSTYIYGSYSKEIVKSNDSGLYIGFLSGASKVYITPITS